MPTPESIAERVRSGMAVLTATERKAAHVLLANYPVVGLETVAEFARRADVSAPTILRFIARLGFANYPEFQKQLRSELDQQYQTPLTKTPARPRPQSDGHGFLDAFSGVLEDNLRATFANLPAAEFDAVVALVASPRKRIFVLGGRFTDGLARYLSAHLRIIRPEVVHVAGQSENWRDQLIDIGRKDVLILFDIRRYQDDLSVFADKASARGATIVLITDQWLSPIARNAAHVLAARVQAPSVWDSSAAILALVEAMIAAVTDKLWDSARERIGTLEALRASGWSDPGRQS